LRQDAQSLGIKGLFCVVGVQQGLSGFGAAAMQLPDLVVIAEAAHALLRQRIAISGRDAGADAYPVLTYLLELAGRISPNV
jgi:hypothetical protein